MTISRATMLSLSIAVAATVIAPGCLPDDLPSYMDGGKTVAVVAWHRSESTQTLTQTLWTYDVAAKRATPHSCPDGYEIDDASMLGDQLWVQLSRGRNDDKPICRQFDASRGWLVVGSADLEATGWLRPHLRDDASLDDRPIPGSWEGKKAILRVVQSQPEEFVYEARGFPDLAKLKTTPYTRAISAGRFWWVGGEGNDRGDQERLHLFNDAGKRILDFKDDFPNYARISDDSKVLLLAFGRCGAFSFELVDIETGKFLWGGRVKGAVTGNPLVRRTEVWFLGDEHTDQSISLIRYRPDNGRTTRPELESGGETIMKVSVRHEVGQYNISPDGSEFVLLVHDVPPRLLFIPIKEGVTEKDVRAIELKIMK